MMEKYNDSTSPSQDDASSDFENSALLNTHYQKQETQRRRNYVYLTLFNLFLFTLSMLSLICAVMSQKDSSSYDAAKLMDQFGIFCKSINGTRQEEYDLIPTSSCDTRSPIRTREIPTPQPAQLV
jgi:hypothetical protein